MFLARVFTLQKCARNPAQPFADARSDAPFIVYGNERLSFAETYAAAARVAHVLVNEYNINAAIAWPFHAQLPRVDFKLYGCHRCWRHCVAMNALWRPDEMAFGLSDSGAKVLIADQERLDRFADIDTPLDLQVIAVRPETTTHPNLIELIAHMRCDGNAGTGTRAGRRRNAYVYLGQRQS